MYNNILPTCTAKAFINLNVLFIAVCNRTYYGEVGNSYRLTLKKLREGRPFLCHLSFTASGQEHGDFVEVRI